MVDGMAWMRPHLPLESYGEIKRTRRIMATDPKNAPVDNVRQGETGHHVRYILGWSLLLVVIGLGGIMLFVITGANPTAS